MKTCTIKVGGQRCAKKIALKAYADHLRTAHSIQLIVNPIETYVMVHEQVEHIYDTVPQSLGSDGVLVDRVLRYFYGMAIYDSNTQRLQIDMEYEDFILYLIPLIGTITRAGRDLRAEAKKNPQMHPEWIISEHVKVLRGSKEISYRNFFKGRKDIGRI